MKSVFDWSEEAVSRVLRVPAGFMRNKVQDRVEQIALDRQVISVNLALVEEGIELGRQMMAEMLKTASTIPSPSPQPSPTRGEGVQEGKAVSHVHEGVVEPVLNESGLMSALAEKREQLKS